jgi:glyoxylase-like metal-dependent hydrolase (beta-lactamase superfamily II)
MMNQLPTATTCLVRERGGVRIHSLVSPGPFFANATHIIELPDQLILIDGQFFAQYGHEFRALADSLQKPITRFYVTHDHPDHYLGMGDAFQDIKVYALPEIITALQASGPHELEEKQHQMSNLVPGRLALPTEPVQVGEEVIGGTKFIFERVLNTEAPVMLTIKLPELGVAIVQDLLYHNTHAFITGDTTNWETALKQIREDKNYDVVLPGHGMPATKADIDNALNYLKKVNDILADQPTPENYKNAVLQAYPSYAGEKLIDIYIPKLFR